MLSSITNAFAPLFLAAGADQKKKHPKILDASFSIRMVCLCKCTSNEPNFLLVTHPT